LGTRLRPDMSNLDSLADAKSHYYGDNFPNGELSSFAYNAESLKLGENMPEAVPATILIQPGEIVTLSTLAAASVDQ
jgi:hypothetical protein